MKLFATVLLWIIWLYFVFWIGSTLIDLALKRHNFLIMMPTAPLIWVVTFLVLLGLTLLWWRKP